MQTHTSLGNRFYSLLVITLLTTGYSSGSVSDTTEIDSILEAAVERGDVPGVVAIAATSDGIIYRGAFGKRGRDSEVKMTLGSVFTASSRVV